MKKLYFNTFVVSIIFFLSLIISNKVFGQNNSDLAKRKALQETPASYLAHPEKGQTQLQNPFMQNSYELIHKRTAYERFFMNPCGSQTYVLSNTPLHYKDKDGWWRTIERAFDANKNAPHIYELRQQSKPVSFNAESLAISIGTSPDKKFSLSNALSLVQKDAQGQIISVLNVSDYYTEVSSQPAKAYVTKIYDGIDMTVDFSESIIKSNYIIHCTYFLDNNAAYVLFRDVVEVPEGWALTAGNEDISATKTSATSLVLKDESGHKQLRFLQPIYTDASEKRTLATIEGRFHVKKKSKNSYYVDLAVPASWLRDSLRVFPLTIDPIVILDDSTVLNTCFYPTYEQGTLSVTVPVGNFVHNTFLLWEFTAVAGTQAWMADQRSYVSGPSGQTAVFAGTGSQAGTQTYTLNTPIGNGVSAGNVDFTFFASREWGGSGCNANFNYIGRRYIEVTHDTSSTVSGGVPVVNEFSASNRQVLDEFGNYEDWIELYNPTSSLIDLTGYYLSDNLNNPTKWQFPGGLIAPGGHLVVVCSGRDTLSGATPHAGFRLTQLDPESVILSDTSGNVLESYTLFPLQNGHSYGRRTDGDSLWGIFANPTRGTANTGYATGYSPKPVLTPDAGFFSAPVTVSINAPDPNVEIRYTTNGSTPTSTSTLYTGPITVSTTTVIRARTFSPDSLVLPGFIETNTYFIDENHVLPVFSFSGDQLNILFGGTQIETIGAYEFFDENGTFIDESVGCFNKHGNDSWNYPQRGVGFIARDEYGYNDELEHKFFATSDRTKFQRLMVKAAANDNYPFEAGGAHIRDSYIQSLSQLVGLDMDVRTSTNCIVYVNGEYWGVYDLREKVDDKDYTRYYYNQRRRYKGSEEYIQFLKTWGTTVPKYGEQRAVQDWSSLINFISNNNMGDSANFAYVNSLLNMESFIDHKVYNSIIVSRDWLNFNTGWWRGLHPSGGAQKWRYILWDTEAALGHFHNYTGIPNVSATAPPCQVENITVGHGHTQSLLKLINENPDVWHHYVSRYADLLNTHLSCDNMIHILDSMVNVIAPEMPRQISRWGGNMTTWQNNVQNVRDFINQRCTFLIQGLINCYNLHGPYDVHIQVEPAYTGQVKMNTVWLPSYPFDAFIFGGIETRLQAQGFGPYVLSHWEVNNHVINPSASATEIILNLTQGDTITAHFHNPNLHGKELLYYWHFNTLETPQDVTSIEADYKLLLGTNPQMTYQGIGARDMDAYSSGSDLNLQLIETAGKAARVRNPSINRPLVFNMPTTGYDNLLFEYAVHRSTNGMLNNIISYSIDGVNFIQTGLPQSTFNIDEDYKLVSVDFAGIADVNDNPDFHIKITFDGNHNQVNGNNRFDNITLKGELFTKLAEAAPTKTKVHIYPNPFGDEVYVNSNDGIYEVSVYNLLGQLVFSKVYDGQTTTVVNPGTLTEGMYFFYVRTSLGQKPLKVVRK